MTQDTRFEDSFTLNTLRGGTEPVLLALFGICRKQDIPLLRLLATRLLFKKETERIFVSPDNVISIQAASEWLYATLLIVEILASEDNLSGYFDIDSVKSILEKIIGDGISSARQIAEDASVIYDDLHEKTWLVAASSICLLMTEFSYTRTWPSLFETVNSRLDDDESEESYLDQIARRLSRQHNLEKAYAKVRICASFLFDLVRDRQTFNQQLIDMTSVSQLPTA